MRDPRQMTIQERFDHLLNLISSKNFLEKKGLGNDVPFFICPYPPQDSLEMDRARHQLTNRLAHKGINVLNINLYDLARELLQERGVWDRVIQIERDVSKDELKELLQGVLDPERYLVPAIRAKMEQAPFDVMFISGVGEVFPYIRSHNVLNNLQSTAKEKPTVMFFPGDYNYSLEKGASLELFGLLHDDNYYRAFHIFRCEV